VSHGDGASRFWPIIAWGEPRGGAGCAPGVAPGGGPVGGRGGGGSDWDHHQWRTSSRSCCRYWTVLYCIVPAAATAYSCVLYSVHRVLHSVLYCTVLYCTVLYCSVLKAKKVLCLEVASTVCFVAVCRRRLWTRRMCLWTFTGGERGSSGKERKGCASSWHCLCLAPALVKSGCQKKGVLCGCCSRLYFQNKGVTCARVSPLVCGCSGLGWPGKWASSCRGAGTASCRW